MDHETLYTASKWDILKHLERGPASPLALSHVCKTSLANISQQLRLLEMAGLVTSARISNRDKGKPRILYSLAGNLSYLIATTDSFVEKKPVALSEYNKVIMRIWFTDQPERRYALEKAFWKIEEHFNRIGALAVTIEHGKPITFCVKWKGKPADIKPFTITDPSGTTHQILFTTAFPAKGAPYILYDPQGILRERSGDNEN